MTVKDQTHMECNLSDTDLFTPAYVQSDIESGTVEEIHPITSFDDNGPVEFFIKNATDQFIDLANTDLKIKTRLVKADGTNLAETDKVAFVNYPIASIFNQLDVYFGEVLISSSNNTYPFRAVLETLLNFGADAKDSQLGMGLFCKDTFKHLEETDPSKENKGLSFRNEFTQSSKLVELIGRLHTDISNQGRLILNGLPIKFVFHRSKDAFCLMANANMNASLLLWKTKMHSV